MAELDEDAVRRLTSAAVGEFVIRMGHVEQVAIRIITWLAANQLSSGFPNRHHMV